MGWYSNFLPWNILNLILGGFNMRLLGRYLTLVIFLISCIYLLWILLSSTRHNFNYVPPPAPAYYGEVPIRPLPSFQPPVLQPESLERLDRLEKLEKLRERFDGPATPLQVGRGPGPRPPAPLERDQHRVHARSRHGIIKFRHLYY